MNASGRAHARRSRLAALLLGFAALAGPVAVLHGQEPTTNPAGVERAMGLTPFSPTQTPDDVPGELETRQFK